MKEYLTVLKRNRDELRIQIDRTDLFDESLLEMAVHDPRCLECRVESRQPVILSYRISGWNDLGQFLDQYVFARREGYRFLDELFEGVIVCGRAKPLLLQPETVFCSRHGDEFRFVMVPLQADAWLLQKETMKEFVDDVRSRFRTGTDFEIPGWLQMARQSRDFSLPLVLQGLRDLERQYHPRKFPFLPEKPKEPFRTREEIIVPELKYECPASEKMKPVLQQEEATQVLQAVPDTGAWLEDDSGHLDLPFESMIIGRGVQADIRILDESISAVHARITRLEDRYYLQDMRSSNGTFLNGKPVRRKMRLKDGMEVRLASRVLVFRQ